MHTLFEEGFGIVGGAISTKAGAALGGWIALSILGLGPFGLFISVFICASVVGVAGNALFKWGGGELYDTGAKIGDHIFHSADDLIGAYQ
jgi:hypothetical protein